MKRPTLRVPKIKVPDKHKVVAKGEHLFHSSYLAVEAMFGHGPLAWLAAGALLCVCADVLLHWFGD